MKTKDFDFEVPDELIARRPSFPRGDARLLWYEKRKIIDKNVFDLTELLRPSDLLIANNTKVIPARLYGVRIREQGQEKISTKIEVLLLELQSPDVWSALIKPLKKVNIGDRLFFSDNFWAIVKEKIDGQVTLEFHFQGKDFFDTLEVFGKMPIPPYIEKQRKEDWTDKLDYQSIFAKEKGSIAAPTASLHFDQQMLRALKEKKVELSYLTLHVGLGTFLPVTSELVTDHKMHGEFGILDEKTAYQLEEAKKSGRRVIAIGTTALRLVETVASLEGGISAWRGKTDIFIYPGYRFKVVDGLLTNFHLPKSTLFMLVAAFIGKKNAMRLYTHAIKERYRFFSYGDASFLVK